MAQTKRKVTKRTTKAAKAAPKNGRRKKAVAKAAPARKNGAKKERIPPGEMPFTMKIRGNLQLHFRALVAEHGQAEAQLEKVKQELDTLRKDPQFAPVWILYKKINDAKIVVQDKRREVLEVQAQIAAKLDLTPEELARDYTIDPDTGVVLHTPQEKT